MIVLLLFVFVTAMLGGFCLHLAGGLFDVMSARWSTLARYASGVMCSFPFCLVIFCIVDIPDDITRFIVSYLLGFGFFGAGVFVGYWIDTIREKHHEDDLI